MTDTTQSVAERLGLAGQYTKSFDDFVGQELAKIQLLTACQAAKERGERLPHVLLSSGDAGIGKTNLALLIAAEMGVNAKVIAGKLSAVEARLALADLEDGDILIYEEIHLAVAGGKSQAESWMLHMLENGTIITQIGPEEQPDVTIIGTTTEPGKLPATILSRFPVKPSLVKYTEEEAILIAQVMARDIFDGRLPEIEDEPARVIARASVNNPRTMRTLVQNLRDVAQVRKSCDYLDLLPLVLDWLGLSEDGLSRTARRYLVALRRVGGRAGATSLTEILNEPGGLGDVEHLLIDKGYIIKTRTGRELLGPGIRLANQLAKELK